MKRFYFNKLVRDKVVDDCLSDPEVLHTEWKILNDDEYKRELIVKVAEEANEIPPTNDSPQETLSEIADLQNIVDALREVYGFSKQEIRQEIERKVAKKGGFAERKYITYVDLEENSVWLIISDHSRISTARKNYEAALHHRQ